MKKGKIYIGTSGYQYFHWRKVFYPGDLISYRWLEYYTKYFQTVELNVTFYRLPQEKTFKSWYRRVPEDFLFVVKGSRFITHIKRLKGVKKATKLFFQRVNLLKEKLGLILWQFPPSFKIENKNLERLQKFLEILSSFKTGQAFEFRHQSCFSKEVFQLLKKYRAALVIADSPRFPLVEKITSNFIYLRFHGGKILYGSKYSSSELKEWAKKIKKWQKRGFDIYAYFNNDAHGYAVENALELIKMTKQKKKE